MRLRSLRAIHEERISSEPPLFVHPAWREAFPWLVQGVTGRGDGERSFDLACFGSEAGGAVWERWRSVAAAVGVHRVVQGRQVHEATVRLHRAGPPGVQLVPDADGHATADRGVLLTVTVADCVPVYLVDPDRRAVGLLHAGWRGIAAGVLARGVDVLRERLGIDPSALRVHLGPAICGDCYEVGAEVHRALDLPDPGGPAPVDLRAVLAGRAERLGIPGSAVTTSTHCTRCGDEAFYSHRGGDAERQAALIGVHPGGRAS